MNFGTLSQQSALQGDGSEDADYHPVSLWYADFFSSKKLTLSNNIQGPETSMSTSKPLSNKANITPSWNMKSTRTLSPITEKGENRKSDTGLTSIGYTTPPGVSRNCLIPLIGKIWRVIGLVDRRCSNGLTMIPI